jgi:hypothetical protein
MRLGIGEKVIGDWGLGIGDSSVISYQLSVISYQ